MKREPAWPALTAGILFFSSLKNTSIEELSSKHAIFFEWINASIYALVISISCERTYLNTHRRLIASIITLILALLAFSTMPRLVNNYNNEALATLLLLISSILMHYSLKGTWRTAIGLESALGLLALTKAQYLYIALVPAAILLISSRKKACSFMISFILVISPWIMRNYVLFEKPDISERGKTVAAIRLIMTAEHTLEERACMLFAFSHPKLKPIIGERLQITDYISGF